MILIALTKWGLPLSLLVGGIAVILRLPLLLQNDGHSYKGQRQQEQEQLQTFCYQGVWTGTTPLAAVTPQDNASNNSDSESEPQTNSDVNNCFTISTTTGLFTRVFSSSTTTTNTNTTAADHDDDNNVVVHHLPGYALPGLWDGHGHLLQYGEFLHSVDLFGAASPAEARRRVRDYVAAHPGVGTRDRWVRGVGWDQMVLGGMPTADILSEDPHLKDLFIMLDRVDVHCTWVSQPVLDLLSSGNNNSGGLPIDVPGGEIVRDPGMGVFCDNAMDLVTPLWPRPGRAEKRAFLRAAARELHRVGIVGVHDAGVVPDDLALFADLSSSSSPRVTDDDDDGESWALRVYAMLECRERNTFCPEDAAKVAQESDFLTVRSVKLFADGALGSWGSAMLEPYADRPDATGSLLVNASTLTSLARSWSAAGFQVNIHAIGDLANRLAIDALEAALTDDCPEGESKSESESESEEDLAVCQTRRRFRIEHAQIIHPADQRRMHRLGIIPSIQPTHATSDMRYAEARLGPERTRAEAYRMRSLLDLRPVLGSDFPVEPPNPFAGLYAAVARRDPQTGGGGDGWHVEEALTLDEALRGFTMGPARAAFMEGRAGVIAEGAFADWIVLDRPLDDGAMDVEALRFVKPRETWVGGQRVYVRREEEEEEEQQEGNGNRTDL